MLCVCVPQIYVVHVHVLLLVARIDSHASLFAAASAGDMDSPVRPETAVVANPCAPRQGVHTSASSSTTESTRLSTASSATVHYPEVTPKRTRLRSKAPNISAQTLPEFELPASDRVAGPIWDDIKLPEGINDRQMYMAVNRTMKRWAKKSLDDLKKGEMQEFGTQFYETVIRNWRQDPAVHACIVTALERTMAPSCVREWARERFGSFGANGEWLGVKKGNEKWLDAHQCLMTWNGEWGLIKLKDGVSQLPTDWRDLVAYLRPLPEVQSLWQEFVVFVKDACLQHFIIDWAASMELCMTSWQDENTIRIHMHMCWKSSHRIRCKNGTAFVFRKAVPHLSSTIATLQARVSGSWCGLYYLMCPKIGLIESTGSKQPFLQFPVNGDWVFSMLQSQKMELKDARTEIIKCGKGLVRKLADLDKLTQMKMELSLEHRISEVQTEIAKTNLVFKKYDLIENWKEKSMQPFQRRKKFLVMEGPSGVGKTEYVRALFGADALLELNAANCGRSPDLRQFNAIKHKVVLFDEAPVELVLENRKLFQAPACWIDLGHSPTGMSVYRVFLNDACLVIASNRWQEQLQALASLSDRHWIEANQVLVVIKEKMFLEQVVEEKLDGAEQ